MTVWHRSLDDRLTFHPFRDALDVQRITDGGTQRLAVEEMVVP